MKALTPVQSLLFLFLAGIAIAGWFYGLHWKRVASGDLFSADEMMVVRLQDQIDTLFEENTALHKKLRSLNGEPGSEAAPKGPDLTDPLPSTEAVTLPSTGPVLPAGPQKIETH